MKTKIRMCGLWLAAFMLAAPLFGCAGAMSGVTGSTLTRTGYPRVSVMANAPFELKGHGRQWVSIPTEYLGTKPSGTMDYAVYGQNEDGVVTRHAHALFAQPSDERAWYFKPESYPAPGGLSIGRNVINGYAWTDQIIRVDGETDWFSAMWRESGYTTPQLWIARRFSATPDRTLRVVAEYRESWPECLDRDVKDLVFAREECLGGFLERSAAAFTLQMQAAENPEQAAAPSVLAKPPFAPDMKKLAGELLEEDFSFRRWR